MDDVVSINEPKRGFMSDVVTEQPQDAATASSQDVLAQYKAGKITQQQAREQLRALRPTAEQYGGGNAPSIIDKTAMAADVITQPVGLILPKTQKFLFGYQSPKEIRESYGTPEGREQVQREGLGAMVEGATQIGVGRILGATKAIPSVASATGLSLGQKALQGSKGLVQALPRIAASAGTFGAGKAAESLIEGETPKEAIGKGLQTAATTGIIDIGLRSAGGLIRGAKPVAEKLSENLYKTDLAQKTLPKIAEGIKRVKEGLTDYRFGVKEKHLELQKGATIKTEAMQAQQRNIGKDIEKQIENIDNKFANKMTALEKTKMATGETQKTKLISKRENLVQTFEDSVNRGQQSIKEGLSSIGNKIQQNYKTFETKTKSVRVPIKEKMNKLLALMESEGNDPNVKAIRDEISSIYGQPPETVVMSSVKDADRVNKLLHSLGYARIEGKPTFRKEFANNALKVADELVDVIDTSTKGQYKPLATNYRRFKTVEDDITSSFGEVHPITGELEKGAIGYKKLIKSINNDAPVDVDSVLGKLEAQQGNYGKVGVMADVAESLGLKKTANEIRSSTGKALNNATSLRSINSAIDSLEAALKKPSQAQEVLTATKEATKKALVKSGKNAEEVIEEKLITSASEKKKILYELSKGKTAAAKDARSKISILESEQELAEKQIKDYPNISFKKQAWTILGVGGVGWMATYALPSEYRAPFRSLALLYVAGTNSPRLAYKALEYSKALKGKVPAMNMNNNQKAIMLKLLDNMINSNQ